MTLNAIFPIITIITLMTLPISFNFQTSKPLNRNFETLLNEVFFEKEATKTFYQKGEHFEYEMNRTLEPVS